MYVRAVIAGAILLVLVGSHWKAYQAGSTRVQEKWNLAVAKDKEHTREIEHENWKRVEHANANAARDTIRANRLSAALNSSQRSLLDTIREKRTATATLEATTKRANSFGELLGACSEEYRAVAESCSRHVIDLQQHRDAWPFQK